MQESRFENWIWHRNPARTWLGLYVERWIYLTWGQQERIRYFNSLPFPNDCTECWHLFGLEMTCILKWLVRAVNFLTPFTENKVLSHKKSTFFMGCSSSLMKPGPLLLKWDMQLMNWPHRSWNLGPILSRQLGDDFQCSLKWDDLTTWKMYVSRNCCGLSFRNSQILCCCTWEDSVSYLIFKTYLSV